jgi:hypothetical protein
MTDQEIVDIGETLREMIVYFEGCYKNAGGDTKAQERFGRYLLVLNLMLEEGDGNE